MYPAVKSEGSLGEKCTLLGQRVLYKVHVGSGELGPRTRIKEKSFPHRSNHEGEKQRMGDKRLTVPKAAPQPGQMWKEHYLEKASQKPHQKIKSYIYTMEYYPI